MQKLGFLFFLTIALFACNATNSGNDKGIQQTAVCTTDFVRTIAYTQSSIPGATIPPQVAAVTFSPYGKRMLIAYSFGEEQTGAIAQVSVSDGKQTQSTLIGHIASGLTRFSRDGTRMVSAAFKPCSRFNQTRCADIQVWDTQSGQLISVPRAPSMGLEDIAISSDGHAILTAQVGSSIYDPSEKGGFGFGSGGVSIESDIISVALAADAKLFAYGLRNRNLSNDNISGAIGFFAWNGERWDQPVSVEIGPIKLGAYVPTLPKPPLRMAFDRANRQLAVLDDESLFLLDYPSLSGNHPRVALPKTTLGTLSFNPLGLILAVGHSQGLKVLNIPNLKTLFDEKGPQVISVAFSPDGCLLAWGDAEGIVHIINAPKP
jgi:WD40 repeat protein